MPSNAAKGALVSPASTSRPRSLPGLPAVTSPEGNIAKFRNSEPEINSRVPRFQGKWKSAFGKADRPSMQVRLGQAGQAHAAWRLASAPPRRLIRSLDLA